MARVTVTSSTLCRLAIINELLTITSKGRVDQYSADRVLRLFYHLSPSKIMDPVSERKGNRERERKGRER